MHPVLSHKHSDCQDVIAQLQQCHTDHPLAKFIGHCNPFKQALNDCLQRDYEQKRQESAKKAQTARSNLEKSS